LDGHKFLGGCSSLTRVIVLDASGVPLRKAVQGAVRAEIIVMV